MDDELSKGIFDEHAYEAAKPLKKDFSPWHKPRKQFVRSHQWRKQIKALLEENLPSQNGILKYIGLPGSDLLDLRYFHDNVCVPHEVKLRFLGFVKGAAPKNDEQVELNISLDEVNKLPNIDDLSEVIPDDFCLLANINSIAWNKAKEFGFFDIVNLDLCDGFGAKSPNVLKNTYYDALNSLLALQIRNPKPWLLFLTTRTGNGHIASDVLTRFHEKYAQNLTNHDSFRDISQKQLGILDQSSLQTVANTPEGHLSIFLTGLCKWILGLCLNLQPPIEIEIKSTIGYRVNHSYEHDDLVSLAIKCIPTHEAPTDPLGLSQGNNNTNSEGELAGRVLQRVVNRLSADDILANDDTIYNDMVDETALLLEQARYDVPAFHNWLKNI